MDFNHVSDYFRHNWLSLALLPGNILVVEAIVRQAAVNQGYTKVVSLCDRIARFVGFLGQIVSGLINRNQNTGITIKTEVKP